MPPPEGLASTVPPPEMVETKPETQQLDVPQLCSIGVGPDTTDTIELRDSQTQTDVPQVIATVDRDV